MRVAIVLVLAGCVTPTDGDVVGPFTGLKRRYAVDRITLPITPQLRRELADDLNQDGSPDNNVGQVIGILNGMNDVTEHGDDMVAAGAIQSTVEITADDMNHDDTVSVAYRGSPDDEAIAVGGRIVDGIFQSNRSFDTRVPGRAVVYLPVFVAAEPSRLTIEDVEIDFQPASDGGYNAQIRGFVEWRSAIAEAYRGSQQMVAANPVEHLTWMQLFDAPPRDWHIAEDEFETEPLVVSYFSPDVTHDGHMWMSIGIGVHFVPCDVGRCTSAAYEHCYDRILDGDETDVDCGGHCDRCGDGAHCLAASDCESTSCDVATCATSRCDDGIRDGFETDVDCSSRCGVVCQVGQRCHVDSDCAFGHACGTPCTSSTCTTPYFDTCR